MPSLRVEEISLVGPLGFVPKLRDRDQRIITPANGMFLPLTW